MRTAKRRVRALELIEQLQKHEMEDEVRELGVLHGQIDKLDRERRELLEKVQREAHIVSIEAAPYVGSFIRALRTEIATREQSITQLEEKAEALEDAVRERFRELKTYTTVLDRTRASLAQEQNRRETAQVEEQIYLSWGRRGERG